MSENAEILPGGVTQAQVNQWKNRWGKIVQITVALDEGKQATAYFRKPGIDTLAAAATRIGGDPIGAGKFLFDNCWLGGDEIIKTDDESLFSVILEVNKLFDIRATEVKNL